MSTRHNCMGRYCQPAAKDEQRCINAGCNKKADDERADGFCCADCERDAYMHIGIER